MNQFSSTDLYGFDRPPSQVNRGIPTSFEFKVSLNFII